MFSGFNNNQSNFNPQQNNPPQNNNDEEEKKRLALKINNQLNTFDFKNPQGLINQTIKNKLGLNFKNFNNSYARNVQVSDPAKTYFLTHNLRTNLEKDQTERIKVDDLLPKYNAQKFEQISNNYLNREKDYYQRFVEINGNISLSNISNINNITSELRKINANSAYNYMQENPDFDFDNNKMGIYLLLQQNGNSGKIFDSKYNKLSTSNKRCNEHQRRKEQKKKLRKDSKAIPSFNKISGSKSKSELSLKGKISSMEENSNTINIIRQKKSYLVEEESNLFEKYFSSFIRYFKELESNKRINTNDKILKLREVLDLNINDFREGRKNFCQFLKRIITPLGAGDRDKLTTRNLVLRVIKYLEEDFSEKNFRSAQNQTFKKKEDFISNYTNNIVYTYFSNVISNSQSKTIILWAKIYFHLRFGWKRDCIEFINQIEGIYINEPGLREMKESLDNTKDINIHNYNEFKRIINQERKEENPFKHACMVYMTQIPDQLYNNILLEINDHLWFNLNLICPKDNYEDLYINKNENEDDNIFEINTSSNQNQNQNNNEGVIKLVKLENLQGFFENIGVQEIINSNNKNTNFAYVILMAGLLKFKKALSFMIKNSMYVDAINFYFILQQLGIYSDFTEINDKIIDTNINKKISLGENNIETEEIYQIYPRVSDNVPALMLYCIYSTSNYIKPLSYLLLETEAFGLLDNYHKEIPLFQNSYNNINICLKSIMSENDLKKLCKSIFNSLLKHKMRNNANLNPLFNIFKNLKMLTELTGILINKSIELLNLKKPIITYGNNGEFGISLSDNKNQRFLGYSLIMNYFGALINDVNKLYLDKQNKKEKLIQSGDNRNNEKIFELEKELEDINLPISLLKQLPIIENIYECILFGNFDEAFKLFMENISIVQIGFRDEEKDYISIFSNFINDQLKKMKYGLMGLYPDILFLFVWLLKNELGEFLKKGSNNILSIMKENCKALEYLLDRLVEVSNNDRELMEYASTFKLARDEVNQIQQFYQQNNYIL